jgi:tyrosyl-tRNA synthetase
MSFLHFIRDVGKHITVNYMMSKDSVKKRIDGENGMSFTEFTYQLVQGYDFYWLHQNKNCKLQMGGSDQWGNIVTGTELIRKKAGAEAFAFTCPLITKADGGKFGKTEKGNIWLDIQKTSAFEFYQFWLNSSDEDATKWIKIFTLLDKQTVDELLSNHQQDASKRILQKKLAEEVTTFIHGNAALQEAIETTQKIFANKNASVESLSEDDLNNLQGLKKINVAKELINSGLDVVSLLAITEILPSKGEAKKMIAGGGISINKQKISDITLIINESNLLHHKYILAQKGQKNFYLLVVE